MTKNPSILSYPDADPEHQKDLSISKLNQV